MTYEEKTGMINLEELEVQADDINVIGGCTSCFTNCSYCCPDWMF